MPTSGEISPKEQGLENIRLQLARSHQDNNRKNAQNFYRQMQARSRNKKYISHLQMNPWQQERV